MKRAVCLVGFVLLVGCLFVVYPYAVREAARQDLSGRTGPFPPLKVHDTELAKAKKILEQRKAYMEKISADLKSKNPQAAERRFDLAVIFEVMNFTEEKANVLNYGYLALQPEAKFPVDNEEVLQTGAGLCGSQTALFLELTRHLGYESRSVQFFYLGPDGAPFSHIAAEVKLGGRWIFVDATYQAVFRDVKNKFQPLESSQLLSFAEITSLGPNNIDVVENKIDGFKYFWEFSTSQTGGNYSYLFSPKLPGGVLIGGNGRLFPFSTKLDGSQMTVAPNGIQNFIGQGEGHEVGDVEETGVELVIPNVPGRASLSIQLADVECNRIEPFRLKLYDPASGNILGYADKDGQQVILPDLVVPTAVAIGLDGEGHWDVPGKRVCYATWRSVTVSQERT